MSGERVMEGGAGSAWTPKTSRAAPLRTEFPAWEVGLEKMKQERYQ